MKDSYKNGHIGNISLFIIDLWLDSLLLWVNETLSTFLVLHLLIAGLSMTGRYMWLNRGQSNEEKLKSKAKRRDYAAEISMLLPWPVSWGIVATLSTPVQLLDALLDLRACPCNAHFQDQDWAASSKEPLGAGHKWAPTRPCSVCPCGATGQPSGAPKWWRISAVVGDSFQSCKVLMWFAPVTHKSRLCVESS